MVFRGWRYEGSYLSGAETLSFDIADGGRLIAEYESVNCFEPDIGSRLPFSTFNLNHYIEPVLEFPLADGTMIDGITVNSDGFVWLSRSIREDPTPSIAGMTDGKPRIAAFWTDLVIGGVHYREFDDHLMITWKSVRAAGQGPFTVQLKMYGSGRVVTSYFGSVPTDVTAIVGLAGDGVPAAVVDASNSWDSGSATAFFEPFIPGTNNVDLGGRVISFWPNGSGGYAGNVVDANCDRRSSETYGSGCPTTNNFYSFGNAAELSNRAFDLAPNAAGGYDVTAANLAQSYDLVFGDRITIGDDATEIISLPFAFDYPGSQGTPSTAIGVCSNGYLWLDGVSTDADYTPSVQEFLDLAPRLAPMWLDLNPAGASSDGVYVKLESDRAVFTWHQVTEYNRPNLLTFQVELRSNGGITVSYPGDATTSRDALVGFSPGNAAVASGPISLPDVVPFSTSAAGGPPLSLDVATDWRPIIGTSIPLDVWNIPSEATLGVMHFGLNRMSLPLAGIGAPGCFLLSDVINTQSLNTSNATRQVSISIPNRPELLGGQLQLQAAVLAPGLNVLGLATSNGVELTLGEF